MFDITFVSYNEPNAEDNWNKLRSRFPIARRVHGVKGIHQAHIAAAKKSYTEMFWVVDGDSEILDTFDFSDPTGVWIESVYVYKALNPVNNLVYGYSGIKLLPTEATINMKTDSVDMTTSIVEHFTSVDQIASIAHFNTDPFSTWRSAFRECSKLSSKVIDDSYETVERLDTWCNVANGAFADYAIAGAVAGRKYGEANRNNLAGLSKINDFEWLKDQFSTTQL
jgi:hypothetical protein